MRRVALFGYPVRLLIDEVEGETIDATEALSMPPGAAGLDVDSSKVLDLINDAIATRPRVEKIAKALYEHAMWRNGSPFPAHADWESLHERIRDTWREEAKDLLTH